MMWVTNILLLFPDEHSVLARINNRIITRLYGVNLLDNKSTFVNCLEAQILTTFVSFKHNINVYKIKQIIFKFKFVQRL